MENQVVRRRVNMIVGHFAGNEDSSATHLLPLNCSNSVNSVIRRCDNRMLFARQGSISQACFMRQVTIKENFGECKSLQHGVPPCSSGSTNKHSSRNASQAPLFSRPYKMEPEPTIAEYRPAKNGCQLSMEEPPKFSRPYRGLDVPRKILSEKIRLDGIELSPQMDVTESGGYYVMTVKLPGVDINNIRVEVDEQNLIVTGKRSTQWWGASSGSKDSVPTYQKRGPYQLIWSVPSDVNKDHISAEFVNGVLQITLPKI